MRCLARRPDALPPEARPLAVAGDLSDDAALRRALDGVRTAYYLVHAMADTPDFAARDREHASGFAAAARDARVERIVYLGGLGRGPGLSPHLASRHEVGDLLRATGVPVVELRASVVLGAGSSSFEIARTLVEKLPLLVTPTWVRTPAQPVAVDDVIDYLLEAPGVAPGTYEIGGADRVSYGGLMAEIARQRGLRRFLLPVPVLSPAVSALWLRLVVPRHARVGKLLIDGVKNETTVADDSALRAFSVRPVGIVEAVRRALEETPPPPAPPSGLRSGIALALALAASFSAAAIGGLATADGVRTWYPTIAKPAWTPPAWLFGPVWTALYTLMGVAAWRVWRRDGLREARLPLAVFALQLVLNAAWSLLFFGWHRPGLAFAEILVLWAAILATTVLFSARDRLAAVLFLPYLAWVTFAAALNFALWRLNA